MQPISLLLDAAAKATAVLAAAFALSLAMRKSSAASRYLLWACALVAILAVPVLSLSLPRWNVRIHAPAARRVVPPPALAAGEFPGGAEIPAPAPHQANAAPGWLLSLWLAGVVTVFGRLAAGHFRLWLTTRRAPRVRSPEWIALAADVSARIGLKRPASLRRTREADVPLSCGLFRGTVLLPESSEQWDVERRRVVLLHELTHVRRRDPLLHTLARVAAAFYWFHPLAWLGLSRFRREQERSCDDAVIRAGAARSAYARHLVELARSIAPSGSCSAALAMAAADLEPRVRALLDPNRKRNAPGTRVCIVALAAAVVAVVPLAALRAQDSRPAASLSGSVFDASGAAIPGARILLANVDGSNVETVRSGDDGAYELAAIPPGAYKMHAGAPGLAEFEKTIVLAPGAVEQLNITLDVGEVAEAMDVVGKGPRPRPVTGPRRVRVGGNVQATKLVSSVTPVYPPGAQAAGIQGTVLLRAVISIQGELLNVSVVNRSVDPELARSALDAVRQWRYRPTLLNGAPVEVITTIAVRFRLEQ